MLTLLSEMVGMPDDDRIPRYLSARWRKVLRCLQGRESLERTSDAVTAAPAETMRTAHGVPGLPGIAARMQQAATGGSIAYSRIPGSEEARWHVPTDITERAAAGLAATMREELALVSPDQASLILAEKMLGDVARAYGLDRMAPVLTADGVYGAGELNDLYAEILASDQVSKLAKRLLRKLNGIGLRAPMRRRVRMPMADLIHTDLADLQ